MATSVLLNPWIDRSYNFQEPKFFYGPKTVWAHKNFLDTYNLKGAHFDNDERKDIETEFDCVSRDLNGLSRIDRRHYKKDSRFVLDLYTLTYGSNETLDSIGDLAERRNDREEIRKRLAKGTDSDPLDKGGRRKPNLQTRLQNGMNLQICFMNDTVSDDNESPNSEAEPKSLPPNNTKSCQVSSNKQPQSLSCHLSNTNKTNSKYTRPSTTKLTLPLTSVCSPSRVSSVADFFARQAQLQSEARKALSESKETARRLMAEERETHPISPITEIIRTSLTKVGVSFPKDRRRLSRQLLTDMNVAQLQVIVNDLHTQIEYLNEKLVRYLMERDELHMTQDSMLVDIEDLTRYLSAKQKSLKNESIENNNNNHNNHHAKVFSFKPQMNRIATLVKK